MSIDRKDRKILDALNQSTLEQLTDEFKKLQKSLINIPEIQLKLNEEEEHSNLFDTDSSALMGEVNRLFKKINVTAKNAKEIKDNTRNIQKHLEKKINLIESIVAELIGHPIEENTKLQKSLNKCTYEFKEGCERVLSNYHIEKDKHLTTALFSQYLNTHEYAPTNLRNLTREAWRKNYELQKEIYQFLNEEHPDIYNMEKYRLLKQSLDDLDNKFAALSVNLNDSYTKNITMNKENFKLDSFLQALHFNLAGRNVDYSMESFKNDNEIYKKMTIANDAFMALTKRMVSIINKTQNVSKASDEPKVTVTPRVQNTSVEKSMKRRNSDSKIDYRSMLFKRDNRPENNSSTSDSSPKGTPEIKKK